MRRLLRLQVARHRLATGFADDETIVAGKTGTILNQRCEVGVVERPDHRRYAVAVFVEDSRPTLVNAKADAVIGTAAHLAVDHLSDSR
jgi:beta-lactamase class A